MPVSVPDFWKLVLESRLLTRDQCQRLATRFGNAQGAVDDATTLAKWLVSQNILSRYQATVLLAGRAGPFCYGDYRIKERIESGRFKGTFRALHAATNHPVLLRFLTGAAAQDAALARITSSLAATAHPNLARVHDVVNLGRYRFFVCEDLQGHTLEERLRSGGPLPASEAARVTRLAATGLEHLHQAGRTHGDLRPRNIWLGSDHEIKVICEPDVPPVVPNVLGSGSDPESLARADYWAPEFLQPGKTPDQRTDIYALGCTLYESLAGQPPFAGGTLAEKMQRHAAEAIRPLDTGQLPRGLAKAVSYMMAKNPSVRFQQASVVREQLAPFAPSAEEPAPLAPTWPKYAAWLQQRKSEASPPVVTPVSAQTAVPAPSAVAAQPAALPHPTAAPAIQIATPAPVAAPSIQVAPPSISVQTGTPSTTSSQTTAARRAKAKSRNRKNAVTLGVAGGIALLALTAGGYMLSKMNGPPAKPDDNDSIAKVEDQSPDILQAPAVPPSGEVDAAAADQTADAADTLVVEDDGTLLWASPTAGSPIELKYVPNGARLYLIVRPAEMLQQEQGPLVLKALGPDFESARLNWEAAAGVSLEDVEQLTLAVYPNAGQFPSIISVVQLAAPPEPQGWLARWDNPTRVEELRSVYQKGELAYFIPEDGQQRVFVMGTLSPSFREMVGGDALRLNRDIGRLLQVSDSQRHATILLARDFLYGDGRQLFEGTSAASFDAVDWFLGSGLKAAMASLHFGDTFYFEMRAQNDVTTDARALADTLKGRIDEIPERLESYLYTLTPPVYWRPVFLNFKPMINELHRYTRVGVDHDQAMVNSVLPAAAAHNLAFGGEMLLALTPGSFASASPAATPAGPKTIEELLNRKITLSFGELDFVFAVAEVESTVQDDFKNLPFEFKVTILGRDLELDGITRNQKVRDFDMRDASLADVLTAMVRKANPVTVKEPSEAAQKLLWVVAPDPDNPSNKIVLITTRKAAEGKYTLPDVFRPKS